MWQTDFRKNLLQTLGFGLYASCRPRGHTLCFSFASFFCVAPEPFRPPEVWVMLVVEFCYDKKTRRYQGQGPSFLSVHLLSVCTPVLFCFHLLLQYSSPHPTPHPRSLSFQFSRLTLTESFFRCPGMAPMGYLPCWCSLLHLDPLMVERILWCHMETIPNNTLLEKVPVQL